MGGAAFEGAGLSDGKNALHLPRGRPGTGRASFGDGGVAFGGAGSSDSRGAKRFSRGSSGMGVGSWRDVRRGGCPCLRRVVTLPQLEEMGVEQAERASAGKGSASVIPLCISFP